MTWVAVAVGGSALVGAGASLYGANQQSKGATNAAKISQQQFATTNAQEQPFIQSGYSANNALSSLLGLPTPSLSASTQKVGSGVFKPSEIIALKNQGYSVDDILKTGVLGPGQGSKELSALKTAGFSSDDINRLENGTFAPAGSGASGSSGPTTSGVGTVAQGGIGGAGGSTGMGITASPGAQGSSPIPGLDAGYLTHQFNAQDFANNIDPSYGWRLQQGDQALQNSAAAQSGSLSGAALKDLIGYNSGAASTEYGNAFNRYTTQQNNIFSRLSSLSSLGQNAAANVGQQGTALAGQASNATQNAGTAAGAGTIAAGNALSSAPYDYLALNKFMNGSGSSASAGGNV